MCADGTYLEVGRRALALPAWLASCFRHLCCLTRRIMVQEGYKCKVDLLLSTFPGARFLIYGIQ